jgi:MoaA/NifB/PqqE/SkfB family radical SAM enzyme
VEINMSIFTKLFKKTGRFAIPQFSLLQVEPTTRCNLNCVMCPWRGQRQGCGDMTPETFQAVLPSFQHTKEIDFTGAGEPLLNPNLETMVSTAKSY